MTDPNKATDTGLSDAEQLAALRATAGGAAAGIHALNARLASLYDLLEIELEDAPGAELYLRDAKGAIAQVETLATGLLNAVVAPGDAVEPIDLMRLAEAADTRLRRIGKPGYAIADAPADCSPSIHGSLFLLQQLLLEMPALFADDAPVPLAVASATLNNAPAIALCIGANAASAVTDGSRLFERPVADDREDRLSALAGAAAVHGGRVFVARDANAFALVFPQPSADAAGYDRSRDDQSLHGSETILLVDDESMIWDVVIDMLQSLGYTVILAANGAECVEIYKENVGKVDLILLDMIMPEMNGRQAFHALKEIDPHVRVLLQSGYVAEAEARDVLDSGARGFLRKPYRMVDLAARIREVLA